LKPEKKNTRQREEMEEEHGSDEGLHSGAKTDAEQADKGEQARIRKFRRRVLTRQTKNCRRAQALRCQILKKKRRGRTKPSDTPKTALDGKIAVIRRTL